MRQLLALSFVIFCASFLTGQKFIDRSAESDFSVVGVNRGVAVGDYDNDGLQDIYCLLYTSPSPRDQRGSRMPSSA